MSMTKHSALGQGSSRGSRLQHYQCCNCRYVPFLKQVCFPVESETSCLQRAYAGHLYYVVTEGLQKASEYLFLTEWEELLHPFNAQL